MSDYTPQLNHFDQVREEVFVVPLRFCRIEYLDTGGEKIEPGQNIVIASNRTRLTVQDHAGRFIDPKVIRRWKIAEFDYTDPKEVMVEIVVMVPEGAGR